MSDATGRAEMEGRLIEKSLEDESFRQRLLADPRAAVEQELGVRLPEEVRVVAVEESSDSVYLVLPSVSPVGEGGEISDGELEVVAGGGDTFMCTYTCPPPEGATCATCGGCPG
jgi:hypothetical protein